MAFQFFTIGHSTRSLDDFVDLLRQAEVRRVADVRTIPRSRTNPQYNSDELPTALAALQLCYTHIAALGGLRGRTPGIAPAVNAFWKNQSFHNYADYAMSDAFARGSPSCVSSATHSAAPSCALRSSGGAAIAASSPIT